MAGFGERNETIIPPGMGELDIFEIPKGKGIEGEPVVVLSRDLLGKPTRTTNPPHDKPPAPPPKAEPVQSVETVQPVEGSSFDAESSLVTPSPMDWRPSTEERDLDESEPLLGSLRVEYVAFALGFGAVVVLGAALIFALF